MAKEKVKSKKSIKQEAIDDLKTINNELFYSKVAPEPDTAPISEQ
jgi:hypothetical protein